MSRLALSLRHRARIAPIAALALAAAVILAPPVAADEPTISVTVGPGTTQFLDAYVDGAAPPWSSVTVDAVDAADGTVVQSVTGPANGSVFGTAIGLTLPAGRYRIQVSADGWMPGWYVGPAAADEEDSLLAMYGWHRHPSFSDATVVTVDANGVASAPRIYTLLFTSPSTIGGIVARWDYDFDPTEAHTGKVVYAELIDPATSTVVATQQTSSTSLFSFEDVAPGTYTIRATIGVAPDGVDPAGPEDLTDTDIWWYPGTTQASAAETVTVAPGGGHWVAANIATDTGYQSGGDASISGDLYAGGLVTASVPDTDFIPARAAVRIESVAWALNGVAVPGQSGTALVLPPDSAGKTLTATVNTNLLPAAMRFAYSATASGPVAAASGSVFTAPIPTIAGQPILGKTLTAQPGAWTPAGTKTYQWYRGGVAIDGQSARQYIVTDADLDHDLTVAVTGTKSGYATAHRASDPVRVELAAFANSPVPTIKGAPRYGVELTAGGGMWRPQPVDVAYQWYRGGAPIADANAPTYTPAADDIGASLTVSTTGTRVGYVPATRTSAATVPVGPGKITAPKAPLVGVAKVGQPLSIDESAWAPADRTVMYQWQRDGSGSGGAAYRDIAGATSATYTPVATDAGTHVRLKVNITAPFADPVSRTTDPSGAISP